MRVGGAAVAEVALASRHALLVLVQMLAPKSRIFGPSVHVK